MPTIEALCRMDYARLFFGLIIIEVLLIQTLKKEGIHRLDREIGIK